ncbi:hypothetical protein F2Q69_00021397 [Brassica cretica]|uniref:Uncharacterized protein n=1 Tax=Brassica cretica TaxID=69181 RepID=A0A8S9QGS4_BRACR|nr:hypothetical protein F2Q69_00021397 [Brassica cretica]
MNKVTKKVTKKATKKASKRQDDKVEFVCTTYDQTHPEKNAATEKSEHPEEHANSEEANVVIDHGFDPLLPMIFGVSTRDDHRARPSVDIEEE